MVHQHTYAQAYQEVVTIMVDPSLGIEQIAKCLN